MIKLTLLAAILVIISSCGKKSDDGGDPPVAQQMTAGPEGVFSATLRPLNTKLSKNLKSYVTITKYGDDFNVRVRYVNGPGGIHMQGLYSGESCPTDDLNDDSYIDAKESSKSAGMMLIPFDRDLSARQKGMEFFPKNNYYDYEESTSYSLMLTDLGPDSAELALEGKVVIISGVHKDEKLPESVSTIYKETAQKSIPIACGVLRAVTDEEDEAEELPEVKPETTPEPTPQAPEQPEVKPEVRKPRLTVWGRMRSRLASWWRRIGGWKSKN